MLIGYVSDEQYVALSGAQVEFEQDGRSISATTRVTGAIHAELDPGPWRAALFHPDHGAKRVTFTVGARQPYQFRLFSRSCVDSWGPPASRPAPSAGSSSGPSEPSSLTDFPTPINYLSRTCPHAV